MSDPMLAVAWGGSGVEMLRVADSAGISLRPPSQGPPQGRGRGGWLTCLLSGPSKKMRESSID